MAPNINSFKNQLESYKLDYISSVNECPGNFWELSDAVLSHIEGEIMLIIKVHMIMSSQMKIFRILGVPIPTAKSGLQ